MKEYVVYSMNCHLNDRAIFHKLDEAIIYGNTNRQAGWSVTIWARVYSDGGDTLVRPLEVEDIVTQISGTDKA